MTAPARRVVLVGGGVRTGKSDFAVARAEREGARTVLVATAEALDAEMAARIAAHRATRGAGVRTLEEPVDLVGALARASDADAVVVDCLTLWVSNLLMRDLDDAAVRARFDGLSAALAAPGPTTVLVTNEVGMGIVPADPLSRRFRDLTGNLHTRVASAADEVYLGAMGLLLRLKPGPVEPVAR